jgi:ABC-type sugar transport system ATPase subunit
MVGRAALHHYVQREVNRNSVPALQVSGLTDAYLNNVTFKAYAGEILGFAGLAGAGRTETAKAIFGARRPIEGEIRVGGKLVRIRRPADAMRAGIAYVTEDRRDTGMFLRMTVAENIAAADLRY